MAARLVLLCVVAVLVFGAAYIVLSIVARIRRGEWLTRAGPFELSLGRVDEDTELTIARLERRAGEGDALIRRLRRQLETGEAELGDGNGT